MTVGNDHLMSAITGFPSLLIGVTFRSPPDLWKQRQASVQKPAFSIFIQHISPPWSSSLLDLTVTFDTVHHYSLLNRLHTDLGLPECLTESVCLRCARSRAALVTFAVPQGSAQSSSLTTITFSDQDIPISTTVTNGG